MKVVALIISLFAITFNPIHDFENLDVSESKIEVKGNKSFAKFLSHFDKVNYPADIDHSKIQEYKMSYLTNSKSRGHNKYYDQSDIKQFIPEAIVSKFSRMGPPLVVPLDRFYPDDNTLAVTYLVRYPFGLSSFYIKMTLFDLKGNNIMDVPHSRGKSKSKSKITKASSIMIAGLGVENTTLCSFKNSNNCAISHYKNNWTKDQREFGIRDNSISSYERLESTAITIYPNGKVDIKTAQPSFASLK